MFNIRRYTQIKKARKVSNVDTFWIDASIKTI